MHERVRQSLQVQELLRRGAELEFASRLSEAQEVYREALRLAPGDPEVLKHVQGPPALSPSP